jgi:hypothetical protein
MSVAPGGCRWRDAPRSNVRYSISGPNPVAKGKVVPTPHPAVDRQIQRHLWGSNGAKTEYESNLRAPETLSHTVAEVHEDSYVAGMAAECE